MKQHEKRLFLNARRMTTRERAHEHLKERLRLPEWYGKNLDALRDCLGEISEPTRITIRFSPVLEQMLGEYGQSILRVLRQAAEENWNINLTVKPWF